MMNKPTDLFVMASRDAVKSHVHPRSLLNATSYSLFQDITFGGFSHRMVCYYVLKLGGTQTNSNIDFGYLFLTFLLNPARAAKWNRLFYNIINKPLLSLLKVIKNSFIILILA
jgi:hypothetical protein